MDKLTDKSCDGCIHLTYLYDKVSCCSYLLNTGEKRPCGPGKGCTVKTTKRKKKKERPT
jgi:hypothetical protein